MCIYIEYGDKGLSGPVRLTGRSQMPSREVVTGEFCTLQTIREHSSTPLADGS